MIVAAHPSLFSEMPAAGEFSCGSLISLNWSIKSFSLNTCPLGLSILSPKYELNRLAKAHWQLELFPKGNDDENYVSCHLRLEMPDDKTREWKTYEIELSLRVGDDNLFRQKRTFTFRGSSSWKCRDFIRTDMLKRHHLPNDTFTIQCKLLPKHDAKARRDQQDFEILSRDLTSLLECGVGHDLILQTMDVQFKVHRCILATRWPTLVERLQIGDCNPNSPFLANLEGPNPDTLKTLIKYAYSGIIDASDVSRDVFNAAVLYDFATLRKNLAVYPKEYFGITEFNIEHKTVTWHLDDVSSWDSTPLSFVRVLPVIELYIHELIIVFTTQKTPDGEEVIDVAFRLSNFKEEFPIFFDCKMSLSDAMGETRVYHAASHLFRTAEVWHFPMFIKKSDIVDRTKSLITIELAFSDGPKESRIVKTETEFFSDFVPIKDLRKLGADISLLLSSSDKKLQDGFYLLSRGDGCFPVHRAIIWARWPELRDRFSFIVDLGERDDLYDSSDDDDDHDIRVGIKVTEFVLQMVISYIYSGNIEKVDSLEAREILGGAESFPLPKPLLQRCQWAIDF